MNAKQLVNENNEKRKQLTHENKSYYEDMLVYIRLSFDKSDQETEEVLAEMLDHLILAQKDGRNAEDVFGQDPKQYADEVIGELPQMITKKQLLYTAMGFCYFLATWLGVTGLITSVGYYVFGLGEGQETYAIGSQLIILILSIPIVIAIVISALKYIRWSTFKKISKVKEFLILWVLGVLQISIFVAIIYFMPEFGPIIKAPIFVEIVLGAIFYVLGRIIYKRI